MSILLSGASNRHQVIKLSSNNGGNVTVTSSVSEGPAHAVKDFGGATSKRQIALSNSNLSPSCNDIMASHEPKSPLLVNHFGLSTTQILAYNKGATNVENFSTDECVDGSHEEFIMSSTSETGILFGVGMEMDTKSVDQSQDTKSLSLACVEKLCNDVYEGDVKGEKHHENNLVQVMDATNMAQTVDAKSLSEGKEVHDIVKGAEGNTITLAEGKDGYFFNSAPDDNRSVEGVAEHVNAKVEQGDVDMEHQSPICNDPFIDSMPFTIIRLIRMGMGLTVWALLTNYYI